eukprot:5207879-Amphidinium_carterae.2
MDCRTIHEHAMCQGTVRHNKHHHGTIATFTARCAYTHVMTRTKRSSMSFKDFSACACHHSTTDYIENIYYQYELQHHHLLMDDSYKYAPDVTCHLPLRTGLFSISIQKILNILMAFYWNVRSMLRETFDITSRAKSTPYNLPTIGTTSWTNQCLWSSKTSSNLSITNSTKNFQPASQSVEQQGGLR